MIERQAQIRLDNLNRPAFGSTNSQEAASVQRVQVRFNALETRELESFQLYGFASATLPTCDFMISNISGDNGKGRAIASNDPQFRPKNLPPGTTRIYNNAGAYVDLTGDTITVVSSAKVIINSPEVTINGNLTVNGTITGTTVKQGSIVLGTHRHNETGSGGGTTTTPI